MNLRIFVDVRALWCLCATLKRCSQNIVSNFSAIFVSTALFVVCLSRKIKADCVVVRVRVGVISSSWLTWVLFVAFMLSMNSGSFFHLLWLWIVDVPNEYTIGFKLQIAFPG